MTGNFLNMHQLYSLENIQGGKTLSVLNYSYSMPFIACYSYSMPCGAVQISAFGYFMFRSSPGKFLMMKFPLYTQPNICDQRDDKTLNMKYII